MNGELLQLFPTPVGVLEFRAPTSSEMVILREQTNRWQTNAGNKINYNHNIFDTPGLENFKGELTELINEYFNAVYMPVNPIQLYITNSWANLTEKGEHHHIHSHHNSLLSGTFYLDAQEDDEIQFYRFYETKLLFTYIPQQENAVNTIQHSVKVKKNTVVLFQSNLSHGVPPKNSEGMRISLSFNTFARGTFGDPNSLTQLTI